MRTLLSKVLLVTMAILILAMDLSTIASMSIFTKAMRSSVSESLTNRVQATAYKIQDVNNQEFKMLESFACLPEFKSNDVDLKEKWTNLNKIGAEDSRYIGMGYYDEHGVGWTTTGKYQDLHERGYLQKALTGKKAMLDPAWSAVNGKISTFYAVPVYDDSKKMNGVAVAVVNSMELCEYVKEMGIGNGYYPYIISMSTGNYIASEDLNCLKDAKNISEIESHAFQKIVEKVKAGKSGADIYKDEVSREKRIVAYTPVGGDCDWAVIYDVPSGEYFASLNDVVISSVIYLVIAMVASFLFLWFFISRCLKPLKSLNKKMIENISDDAKKLDLITNIEVKGKDEVATVIKNYSRFNERVRNVIIEITESKNALALTGNELHNSVEETSESIADILGNINSVASQMVLQSNSVDDTAAAVSQIAQNITALGALIESQSVGFSQASSAIEEMIANINSVNLSVEKMVSEFGIVLSKINNSSKKQEEVNYLVSQVAEQSEMLNQANAVIASIANQTNLLAMNAAIEAAHAGDTGKGFSVVAGEIRKLSENSKTQSRTIGEQLSKISSSIHDVVEGSVETSAAFSSVSNSIKETNELVIQIRNAMAEQAVGSKQITEVLTLMNDNTNQVKLASADMESGNDKILNEITQLKNVSNEIKESVNNMTASASKIRKADEQLDNSSVTVNDVITTIANQIEKFIV